MTDQEGAHSVVDDSIVSDSGTTADHESMITDDNNQQPIGDSQIVFFLVIMNEQLF